MTGIARTTHGRPAGRRAAGLLAAAAGAAPRYAADLADPQGDGDYLAPSKTSDIARLRVTVEGGQVLFRMAFYAGTMAPSSVRMGFELDTDRGLATGDASRGLLGVDHYIATSRPRSPTAASPA
ncbi:hypothetical protein [Pseudorhodoferax sp.]|uniref:hypothetical protein n=1 Tax=Pseudorhodoferax sp. TaxID=1993553 RepID=UPI0039E4CF5C